MDWQEMLKTPQFYGLWLMYILSAAPGLMLLSNAKDIATDQAKWGQGVQLVIILSILNTLGRVVAGVMSDCIGARATMVLANRIPWPPTPTRTTLVVWVLFIV
jgi:hypothetical protein